MAMLQKFLANNKKLPISLEKNAYVIGTDGDIVIGGDGVKKKHCTLVSVSGNAHELMPEKGAFVKINNKEISERKRLEHNDVMIFSKKPTYASILVYSNELLNSLKTETRRLSAIKMSDIQGLVMSANTKTRIYEKEFYEDCPLDLELTGLCKYTISFLMSKFKTTRGIIYRTIQSKWIPIVAICPETKYIPSKSLMKEVHQKQEPVLFNVLDFDEENIALSIINNKTYTALCVPIVFKDSMIGVIYMDTIKEDRQLTGEDLMVVLNIVPSFSILFRQAINKLIAKSIEKKETPIVSSPETKEVNKLKEVANIEPKDVSIKNTPMGFEFEAKLNKLLESNTKVENLLCWGDNMAKISRAHYIGGNMLSCFFGYISPIEQNTLWPMVKTMIDNSSVLPSQEDIFLYQLKNYIEASDEKINERHFLNLALFTYHKDKKYLSIIMSGDVCLLFQKGQNSPYKHSDGKASPLGEGSDIQFVEDEINNFENCTIVACKIKESNGAEYVLNKNKNISDIEQLKQDLFTQGINHFLLLKR